MPGRKLGRKTDHRLSMLRGQVTFLVEKGRLETTATRAKEVQSLTEKMITLGKKNTLAAKRQALAFITKEDVVKKLFDEISPDYAARNGGYTRVILTGPRRGDAAEMAIIELVKEEKKEEKKPAAKKPAAKKPAAKKPAAAEEKAEAPAEETAKAPAEETATPAKKPAAKKPAAKKPAAKKPAAKKPAAEKAE